jgi:hypothetical protein
MLRARQVIHDVAAAFLRAGGDGEPVPRTGEELGGQATHLAGASDEDRGGVCAETLKQPRRATVGQGSISAGAGVGAHASAEAQRSPEQLVEDRSSRAICQCRLVRRADLAQQLLLGDNRRVESPDNLKHAPDGLTPSHTSSRGRGVIDAHELYAKAGVEKEALDGGDVAQLRRVVGTLVDSQIAKGREPDADVVEIGAGG